LELKSNSYNYRAELHSIPKLQHYRQGCYSAQTSFSKASTARHSGPSSNKGDRVLGCFLPFFEVVTADVTGPAATWSTCSTKLGAIGLRQIAASSSLRWLWDYKQPF
jgi:hypothetical protein